jgi:hypothetical protein
MKILSSYLAFVALASLCTATVHAAAPDAALFVQTVDGRRSNPLPFTASDTIRQLKEKIAAGLGGPATDLNLTLTRSTGLFKKRIYELENNGTCQIYELHAGDTLRLFRKDQRYTVGGVDLTMRAAVITVLALPAAAYAYKIRKEKPRTALALAGTSILSLLYVWSLR